MNNAMHELRQQPQRRQSGPPIPSAATTIPSGFSELDRALPGGGWPENSLTEVLHDHSDSHELRLLMPALARLSRADRWIALIASPHIPDASVMAAQGVDLSRVLLVHSGASARGGNVLRTLEKALRSGTCAAVLGWPEQADEQQLQSLQLAAEAGRTWGILFRRENTARHHSPAALRLRLHQDTQGGTMLSLLKTRDGRQREQLRLDLDRPRVRFLPARSHNTGNKTEHRQLANNGPKPTPPGISTFDSDYLPQMDLPLDTHSHARLTIESLGAHPSTQAKTTGHVVRVSKSVLET